MKKIVVVAILLSLFCSCEGGINDDDLYLNPNDILSPLSFATIDLERNKVAEYLFTEGSLYDTSDNNVTLTMHGDPQQIIDRHGNTNSAYRFDGTGDYLRGSDTYLPMGSTNRTFSMWIKPDCIDNNDTQDYYIFSYGAGSNSNQMFFSLGGMVESVMLYYYSSSVFDPVWFISPVQSPSIWHHLACSYDSNSGIAKIYWNGNLVDQTDVAWHTFSMGYFYIGSSNTQGDFFEGSIDDIKIWDRTLSDFEIISLASE